MHCRNMFDEFRSTGVTLLFDIQIVPYWANGRPLDWLPSHLNMTLVVLASFFSGLTSFQPRFCKFPAQILNQPFLQRVNVSFYGKWYLKATICTLGVLTDTGWFIVFRLFWWTELENVFLKIKLYHKLLLFSIHF